MKNVASSGGLPSIVLEIANMKWLLHFPCWFLIAFVGQAQTASDTWTFIDAARDDREIPVQFFYPSDAVSCERDVELHFNIILQVKMVHHRWL